MQAVRAVLVIVADADGPHLKMGAGRQRAVQALGHLLRMREDFSGRRL
jgi:hypothetical protein